MSATAITDRAFGIELELHLPRGVSRARLAEIISAAGVACQAEEYSHAATSRWKIVTDGSLGYETGAEVVSPKLYGEAGIAQARTVADALVAAHCKVDTKCGFHVHVDASDFTPAEMGKVAVNYLWFETFFDHVMPPSRRGSHNTYVRSNRSQFGGYGTTALNAGIASVSEALARNGRYTDVMYAFTRGDRYFKLNLTAFSRQGSIEFRQHSGTIEADKVEHWIRLCTAFITKAKVSKPRPRKVIREWTAAEEMHLFFGMFALPEATRRFYMQRRRDLIAADKARDVTRANPADHGQRVLETLQARLTRVEGFRRRQSNVIYRLRQSISRLRRAIAASATTAILAEIDYAVRNRLVSQDFALTA